MPQQFGGGRNWDHRHCSLRDATATLRALLDAGFTDEARTWREWLVRATAGDPTKLQPSYGLDGIRRSPEHTVDWLPGYESSTPIRIGNGAADQFSLNARARYSTHCTSPASPPRTSRGTCDKRSSNTLESGWDQPDNGIWEIRGGRQHFVHSKVMAWAGVDRAIRTAERGGLPAPLNRWRALRARIRADVCMRGYDPGRNTFTQFYGSYGVDAALLLLPRVGFLPWRDTRMRGTLAAVRRELCEGGHLLRYRTDGGVDGLPGAQGAPLVCGFWLADALHGTGHRREASELFEKLLNLRNDVGLLSEEYDPHTGRHLGNTPHTGSMIGLVNTAQHLAEKDASPTSPSPGEAQLSRSRSARSRRHAHNPGAREGANGFPQPPTTADQHQEPHHGR